MKVGYWICWDERSIWAVIIDICLYYMFLLKYVCEVVLVVTVFNRFLFSVSFRYKIIKNISQPQSIQNIILYPTSCRNLNNLSSPNPIDTALLINFEQLHMLGCSKIYDIPTILWINCNYIICIWIVHAYLWYSNIFFAIIFKSISKFI